MLCPDYEPDFDFNPLPRKEGDLVAFISLCRLLDFNPLPRKEGDSMSISFLRSVNNFNPLPRKEGDCKALVQHMITATFQSTPS